MTVRELGERMDNDEFVRWQAFDAVRAAERKKAEQRAEQQARARRRGR